MIPKFAIDRRTVLRGLAAWSVVPLMGCGERWPEELWLSAHGDDDESFGVALLEAGESTARTVKSSFRGHDLAQNPAEPEQVVMFGRRPGSIGLVLDVLDMKTLSTFASAPGHSMMGHGFFALDGALLYSTEADDHTGAGALVARDTRSWEIVDSISTDGIGPHQAALLPDGETAVIANGGILTRPETGRDKLNLDTMRSTLTYVNVRSGRVLSSESLAERKASIRHLEVGTDGCVALGLQLQREAMPHTDTVSLAGIHRPGDSIELFEDGLDVMAAMDDYVGSVALCSATGVAGFTSPRGNLAAFWNIDDGRCVGMHQLSDVSGITVSADEGSFVLSSSTGQVRHVDSSTLLELKQHRRATPGVRWDNHLITVTAGG